MKKTLVLSSMLLAVGIFTGCSNKINLAEYRPMVAQKNELAPKNLTEHKIHKAAIVEFDSYKYKNIDPSKLATNQLKAQLTQSKFVKIDKVLQKNKIDEYIKLAEAEDEGGNKKVHHYIIEGSIQAISYTPTYHPASSWRDKKGRIHYVPPYWSYEVCSDIQTDILDVPSLENRFSNLEHTCINHSGGDNQGKTFFPYLINNSVKEAIKDSADKINKFFAPKGYILEVKRKDDDIIAKISLGKKQGVHPGMEFIIYNLQKDSDTGDINKYKIATAKVGDNTIFANSSWITVDLEENQNLKIGDLVEPNLEEGFLGSAGKFFSRQMR